MNKITPVYHSLVIDLAFHNVFQFVLNQFKLFVFQSGERESKVSAASEDQFGYAIVGPETKHTRYVARPTATNKGGLLRQKMFATLFYFI